MIKLLTLLFLFSWAHADVFDNGVDTGAYEIMPGANIVEQEISWAWKHLPDFLKACLHSSDCQLTNDQRKLIEELKPSFGLYKPATLRFLTEREGGFQSSSGETERLALTGSRPGSEIKINTDRYGTPGHSLGVPFWMGILTHELVHHLGIPDDQNRIPDQLGAKIAQVAESHLMTVRIPEDAPTVTAHYLNLPKTDTISVFADFPRGLLFRAMKMDSKRVIDDAAVRVVLNSTTVCQNAYVGAARISPELVRTNRSYRGFDRYRTHVGFGASFGCYDPRRLRVFGDWEVLRNSFGLIKTTNGFELDLDQAFDWGKGGPGDHFGSFERAVIQKWEITKTVKAGETFRLRATIKGREGLNVIGCLAWLYGPEWPQGDSALPYVIETDRCTFKQVSSNVYEVEMERAIPAEAPASSLALMNLCLMVPDNAAGCIPAYPPKRTLIEIRNLSSVRSVAITDLRALGVRPISEKPRAQQTNFIYDRARGMDLKFLVKNAKQIEQSGITIEAEDAAGNPILFSIPIRVNEFIKDLKTVQQGTDLEVTLHVGDLPDMGQNLKPVRWRLLTLNILTGDLQPVFVDLESSGLSFRAGGPL